MSWSSTKGTGSITRLESKIQKFKPHLFYDCPFQTLKGSVDGLDAYQEKLGPSATPLGSEDDKGLFGSISDYFYGNEDEEKENGEERGKGKGKGAGEETEGGTAKGRRNAKDAKSAKSGAERKAKQDGKAGSGAPVRIAVACFPCLQRERLVSKRIGGKLAMGVYGRIAVVCFPTFK